MAKILKLIKLLKLSSKQMATEKLLTIDLIFKLMINLFLEINLLLMRFPFFILQFVNNFI
jgi:hypothetical protein